MSRRYVLAFCITIAATSSCARSESSNEEAVGSARDAVITPPIFLSCADVFTTTDPGACTASGPGTILNHTTTVPATCTQSPPGPYPVGITPVALTCVTGVGDTRTCHERVHVADTNPPVIACPANQTLTCGGTLAAGVSVSAHSQCSGAALPVSCTPSLDTAFATDATVSCSASDAIGAATCSFAVDLPEVVPQIVTTPIELWPPNHKYHTIDLSDCVSRVSDGCGGTYDIDAVGTIVRVTSDEVEDAPGKGESGDGSTCADMVISGPHTVDLRAERNGTSDGRVYRIHFTVQIGAAILHDSCAVLVPHDQGPSPATLPEGAVAYCVGTGCPGNTGSSSCQ
ncbi:Hypothetical protein A7982_09062 [Minicystis rosea]|nr:Hypothetical protein A7982_09062 [Minicystis rosea]